MEIANQPAGKTDPELATRCVVRIDVKEDLQTPTTISGSNIRFIRYGIYIDLIYTIVLLTTVYLRLLNIYSTHIT